MYTYSVPPKVHVGVNLAGIKFGGLPRISASKNIGRPKYDGTV